MPGMTGFDVLRAMQPEPRLREIPVLMFSAYDSGPLRTEATRLGACDYLVKGSLNWESLAIHIRRHARAAAGSAYYGDDSLGPHAPQPIPALHCVSGMLSPISTRVPYGSHVSGRSS